MKASGSNIAAILVGNKSDLSDDRKITLEEAGQKAQAWNIPYIETSAKTKQNVDRVYSELMRVVKPMKSLQKAQEVPASRHSMEIDDTLAKKPCCALL